MNTRVRFLALLMVILPLLAAASVEGAQPADELQVVSSSLSSERQANAAVSFIEEKLAFDSGDVELAGSLLLPAGSEGPFPAVVMLHGAGPDTREVFWRTGDAETFLQAGLAVFIYDKRGTGQSAGDWQTASIEDLAEDALAAVRLVRQQPNIRPDQVGLFGVSQGGRLTPTAAAGSDEVAFLINVTGAAIPFGVQEMWGAGNALADLGYDERDIATTMKVMHLLFSARPLIQSGVLPLDGLYIWFDALDPYQDPAATWAQVDQPAFVAYGSLDGTVPAPESTAVVQDAFSQGGNPLSRMVIYPEAGHGIRLSSGQWAPGHIETMTAWLQATLAGEATPKMSYDPASIETGSNHWYGLAQATTPWYVSAGFQGSLIFLFIVAFVVALVAGLSPKTDLKLESYGRWPRLTLVAAGLLNIVLMAGLLNIIAYLAFADANNAGPDIPLAGLLAVLAWLSLLLTAGLVFFAVRASRRVAWSRLTRAVYGLVAVAAVIFVGFLAYWNVLTFPL
jgi:pimeloyl-ACP methyl ester carboxylesterase